MNTYTETNRRCPVCVSDSSQPVFEFAGIPLGDNFTDSSLEAKEQLELPLHLLLCTNCFHLFLPNVVNPDLSYLKYHFRSSTSPGLRESMRTSHQYLRSLSGDNLRRVVDIGANDGTWLSLFGSTGAETLGVEPSPDHWTELENSNHHVYRGYFDKEAVDYIENWLDGSDLDLVTINNTLSNISDIRQTFESFRRLDTGNTLFSIITGYHFDQFHANMFDYIYHEHLSYFSVSNLMRLAQEFGFKNFDVRRFPLKGGSIQFTFSTRNHVTLASADAYRLCLWEEWIQQEPTLFATKLQRDFKTFCDKVSGHFTTLRNHKPRVVGYGYSHSVATLMRVSNIAEGLSRIVDDNTDRQGKYTPGHGFLIEAPDTIDPTLDGVFILAWQHSALIERQLKKLNGKVSFASPFGSYL